VSIAMQQIEVVLSLQEALAQVPDEPSAEKLDMTAGMYLIPLEYEKMKSIECIRCGNRDWDVISRASTSARNDLDWPYQCPGGDEHECACKRCGNPMVAKFWFTKGTHSTNVGSSTISPATELPSADATLLPWWKRIFR
jgi:hypothetical protein